MNHISEETSRPKDVTFFIGPIGAPANMKQAFQNALDRNADGDGAQLDEFLNSYLSVLRDLADGSPQEPSPMKKLVESLIGYEIGKFSTYVATGFMHETWTPIVTIHLDRLEAPDGSPLGHLFQKSHGEIFAAMLGRTFKSEWIFTSWTYPRSPIDIGPISRVPAEKEDL